MVVEDSSLRPVVAAARGAVSLPDLVAIRAVWEKAVEAAVCRLRMQDVTWAEIGRVLGISRQGARQRWGYLDESGIAVTVDRRPGGRAGFKHLVTGVQLVGDEALGLPAARQASLRSLEVLVLEHGGVL